jgi:pteridine reductase
MTDGDRQRVALVTGGAVRVGRAISLGLARAGYDLVIAYRSSSAQAATLADEVAALGRTLVHVEADLGEVHAADRLIDAVRTSFGRLDVLVNSAASFQSVPLLDVDGDEWDQVMNLNVRAPHLIVRAAAEMLRESRGCVVNITDLSAWQAWSAYPHHAVSKAALAHLTRVQARALAPEVRVNGIAPGAVLPPDDWPMERWDALANVAVLQRTGSPNDVVQALLFLIEAQFITGHIMPVDGGRLLGPAGPPS